jgi:hypothetical protein
MEDEDINVLLRAGLWFTVTPVLSKGEWKWTCGVYKKNKKTGAWKTETCKTWKTPGEAYDWALSKLTKRVC